MKWVCSILIQNNRNGENNGFDEGEVCKRIYLWLGRENEWKGKSDVVKKRLQLNKFSTWMP
jgi:endo-1,4-beta-D-glucanase Y